MRSLIHALGQHPVPGVIAVLMAGAALFGLEILRLGHRPGESGFLRVAGYTALGLTVVSLILIACRFISVELL